MNRERCQYWASAHYVWRSDPADVLGEGAFGDVYRGFHKETCQYVAIKTFKKLNLRRPSETQLREIQILERLNHPNVVKLIAIEDKLSIPHDEDQSDYSFLKGKALIMEYCTEGNLYSIIEQPENQFGLEEAEMLRVLDHTTSGMKYLRENKIIHRDWKPSNILKTITDDGDVLYKLCDFGAARELEDDQAFLSIVGTEEYIAPDIYGRALLGHGSSSQSFSATSELWSYAVTVYHVTTGQLPFRPFGGRTNRSTMYQITSEKPSGAISGIQDVENGPIQYCNNLPDHCRLSKQCNKFLTYLLANLFEVNKNEAWSFDDFFRVVEEFLSKLPIHCATPSSKFASWIYIDKSAGLVDFDNCIKNQFQIKDKSIDRTNMQPFYYCNAQLLNASLWSGDKNSLQRLSAMSQKSPLLILLRNMHSKDNGNASLPLPQPLPVDVNFGDDATIDVSADYELANRCSSVTFWILKCMKDKLQRREMCTKAATLLLSKIESSSSFLVEKVALLDRLLTGLWHVSKSSDNEVRTISFAKKWNKTNEALTDVKTNLDSMEKNIRNARSSSPNINDNNVLTALDRFVCSIFETVVQFRHDRVRYRRLNSESNDLKWHGLLKKQLKRTWLTIIEIYQKNKVFSDLSEFDSYFQELFSLNADVTLAVESQSLVLEMIISLDNQSKTLVSLMSACSVSGIHAETYDKLGIAGGDKKITDSNEKCCYSTELQEISKDITEIRSIHSLNRQILLESDLLVDQMNTMLNVSDNI